jgi:DUF1016 N-terminal domain
MIVMSSLTPTPDDHLLAEIRQLIDEARKHAASAVNAEITLLYWQVGHRLRADILQCERGTYGQQIIGTIARRLTQAYGRGWSEKQLRHCLPFAEAFPDVEIVSALRRELSWTHLKTLMYIEEVRPLGIILCAGKKQVQIELLELSQSGIHLAEYLTVLTDRDTFQAKLHESILLARQRLLAENDAP